MTSSKTIKLVVAVVVACTRLLAESRVFDNILQGQQLSVVTAELPGVFDIVRNSNGEPSYYKGAAYDMLVWLSQRYTFTFVLEIVKNFEFGKKTNGSYDGLIGYVQRKEKNISLTAFAVHRDYFDIADLSIEWGIYEFSMLIPYPSLKDKTWAALKPFKVEVWMSWVAGFIFMSLAIIVFSKLHNKTVQPAVHGSKRVAFRHWSDPVIYQAGVITAQGGFLSRKGRPILVLGTIWAVAAFVFVSSYSSLLISFLSTDKLDPPVDSLKELAAQGTDYPFFTFYDTAADQALMFATGGTMKALGDRLRQHPERRMANGPTCLREALKQKAVCIDAIVGIEYFIWNDQKATGKCRAARSKETFNPDPVVMLFQKNSPFTDMVNQGLLWAYDMGLIKHWQDTNIERPYRCLERGGNSARIRSIALKDLTSSFLILGIGIGASFLLFITERISTTIFKKIQCCISTF